MTGEYDITEAQVERIRSGLMRHVEGTRQRKRRTVSVAVMGVTAVAAMSATAWVMLAPFSARERAIVCYDQPSLTASSAVIRVLDGEGISDPVALARGHCEVAWQEGLMGANKQTAAPRFAICARADGMMAGFPLPEGSTAEMLCDRLDLASAE